MDDSINIEEIEAQLDKYVKDRREDKEERESAAAAELAIWRKIANATTGSQPLLLDLNLDLSGCQLSALSPTLCRLPALASLNLQGNQLTRLPDAIGDLITLKELNLGDNQLRTLPDTIGNLTNLTHLNLNINNLTTLPDTIGKLVKITNLRLADNQLRALPERIGDLAELANLTLDNNKLTTLPGTIGKLVKLMTLSLEENQQITLPKEIGNLKALRVLNLKNNKLTMLPDAIGDLANLRSLNLEKNDLTALSPEIGKLTLLTSLYLGKNQLTTLPSEIKYSKQLTYCDAANNQIQTLPNEIKELTQLKTLNLTNNSLKTLPHSIENLTQCQIKLTNNPIPPEELTKIKNIVGESGYPQLEFLVEEQDIEAEITNAPPLGTVASQWLCDAETPEEKTKDAAERWNRIGEGYIARQAAGHNPDFPLPENSRQYIQNKEEAEITLKGFSTFLQRCFNELGEEDETGNQDIPDSVIKIIVDGILRPIELEDENRMEDKPALPQIAFRATVEALGTCENALLPIADQVRMAIETHVAQKENWSLEKRLSAGHERFLKSLVKEFMDEHMGTLIDSMETQSYLLAHLCKTQNLPGPRSIAAHENHYHGMGRTTARREANEKNFDDFINGQKLASDKAFKKLQDKYETDFNTYYRAQQPHTTETDLLFRELDISMGTIKDHQIAQGQRLVEFLMSNEIFTPYLDEVCAAELEEIEKKHQNHHADHTDDYHEWRNKQNFPPNLVMNENQRKTAVNEQAYIKSFEAIGLLKELRTIAVKMEPTQRAVKSHLFPNLLIGADRKGKRKAEDTASGLSDVKKPKLNDAEKEFVETHWGKPHPEVKNEVPKEFTKAYPVFASADAIVFELISSENSTPNKRGDPLKLTLEQLKKECNKTEGQIKQIRSIVKTQNELDKKPIVLQQKRLHPEEEPLQSSSQRTSRIRKALF